MTRFTASYRASLSIVYLLYTLYARTFEKMQSASLAAHLFILDIRDVYEK